MRIGVSLFVLVFVALLQLSLVNDTNSRPLPGKDKSVDSATLPSDASSDDSTKASSTPDFAQSATADSAHPDIKPTTKLSKLRNIPSRVKAFVAKLWHWISRYRYRSGSSSAKPTTEIDSSSDVPVDNSDSELIKGIINICTVTSETLSRWIKNYESEYRVIIPHSESHDDNGHPEWVNLAKNLQTEASNVKKVFTELNDCYSSNKKPCSEISVENLESAKYFVIRIEELIITIEKDKPDPKKKLEIDALHTVLNAI